MMQMRLGHLDVWESKKTRTDSGVYTHSLVFIGSIKAGKSA